MWRLAILICLFAIPQCITAQIYNNPGGTITTCSGTFFDSGGTAVNYANSETTVTTFCAANPGEFMSVNFNIFDIEANFDFLTIYNGPTTASLSLGTFTGTVSPGTVTSTDPSGCLTFEFISDGSVTDIGWDATLSCFIPGACTGVTPNCSPAIPDNCASACDLGTLTSLPTCGVTTSVLNTFCLSNVGATAENPYTALAACDDGNDMPIPSADVWYSFVATGNEMSFTITGAIADPSIGLYEGTDCTTFFGRGCNNGTGGAVTLNVDGINAGQTYYLQISGGDETDQGDFNLAMTSTKNCDDCLLNSEFSVTPPPVNNLFNPGDNVTFCYTVTEWNQTAVNWIHAVVPAFSAGWDLTTLAPVSATPLSCDGSGVWIWQNAILGTNGTAGNPGTIGPGYVYDSSLGGPLDGDGGNNFGDNCQGIVNFEFCWSISVDANICSSANTNLAVDIDTYGDSETGSWINAGCLVDPVYNFSAAVVCCAPGMIATTPSTCAGANDGSITMTGSGQAPYDYAWSGPENGTQTNEPGAYTETGLTTGTYSVSITDDNGCQDVQNITVADPSAIFGSINAGDITCNGDADGTLILAGGGGTPPYVFTWSNGFAGPVQSGVSGGIYSITITDANMCTFTTSAEVIEPDVLLPTATGTVVPCNGGNSSGDISLTVTGGTTPYTFNWDNGAGTAQNPTGLAPGTYNVTVTDANMCTAATSAEVSVPPALTASATGETLLCAQDNNGDISLTVGGGTPGYNFQWNNGGGFVQNPTNLPPGIYTVTVTDANMCTITAQATIDAPAVLSTVTASGMPPTCNNGCDGTVTVSEPTGGTPPYTYTWSDGLGTGQTIAGTACAGGVSYTVTVSDANACSVISSVSLFNPPPMATTVTPAGLVCDGNNDGTATISVTNGTAPFTYVWDDGMTIMTGTGPTITGLSGGNYDLTITDVNGCMAITSMTVQAAPAVTATAAQDSGISCNGESDGTATVTIITGTPTYTYNWDNGESGATATMLGAGTHTVTITDMNGCIGTTDVLITEPPVLTLAATLNQDASCTGDTDGSATATAAGGTPNYTYDWDNGESGATATMLDAGIHTVTVTDLNGCIETTTITIGDPAPLAASGLGEGLLCNGDTDGDISLTVNGGTTPYMFNWTNGGGTDQNPSGLGAGVYDVVVTDANGCIITATAEITEPTLLGSSVSQDNSVLCTGEGNGAATVNASGGTPPYSYNWDNGETTASATMLDGGLHDVTITDNNGCIVFASITIGEPAILTSSATGVDLLCNGETGDITLTVNGGTTPYTFVWTNGAGTDQNPTGLGAGTYDVVVTDASGCTATATADITEPAALTASATGEALLCNGDTDGDITLTVNGGTTPYTFQWDNGAGTDQNPTGLGLGTYNVTVTDANACVIFATADITEPTALTASATGEALSCNGDTDGDITLTVNGGTTPYTFQWDNGAGTDQNPTGLGLGTYNVTVTDANACVIFATADITEPTALTASATGVDLLCNGETGDISLTVNGGTTPYTFVWTNGAGTDQNPTGLGAGTYDVVVTDANGCTATATADITEPAALTASATGEALLCNGDTDGDITLTVNGGTTPYTFQWDNGAGTDQNPSGLGLGTYNVTVTDANACVIFATADITEPTALTASATGEALSCNGDTDGDITLTVNGGTTPYTFQWDNGAGTDQNPTGLGLGTYNVTVTDANACVIFATADITEPTELTASATGVDLLCNGETGDISLTVNGGTTPYTFVWTNGAGIDQNPTGLGAGTYDVVVTDANGCTATATADITEPAALTASATGEALLCNGDTDGDITLTVNGGTTPYTFQWDNGAGTDQNPTGLGLGTYNVTVTDANSCIITATADITEPTALTASATGEALSCNGDTDGDITLTVNGGTTPYTFQWDNGAGTDQNPTGLGLGTYNVTVTDANACVIFATADITEPTALTASATGVDLLCNGETGDISLTVNGGTTPYTFVWTNGAGTDQNPTGLGAGTYDVVVTDANGCTATATADITEPAALTASATGEALLCNGDTDGDITLTVNGGTTPYTFQWDNGAGTDQNPSGLGLGTYNVTVTDANACVIFATADITEPTALTASATGEALSCNGDTDGDITLTVNGGTTPYTFQWDNGAGTDQNPTGLGLGTYNVTVTDANACVIFATADITEPTALTASATGVDLLCNGETGDISLTVNGGTTPYTFQWDNGAGTDQNPSGLGLGTYNVTVTDANACVIFATADITEPTALTASATGEALSCNGDTDGDITLTVNGGTTPYTYQWTNGAGTNPNPTGLGANTYTVTVTDANNCTITASADITEPAALTATAVQDSSVSCPGETDGQATVTLGGGTTPYTYEWDNSETTATATMLGAGAHDVTITDANNCVITASVTIDDAPPLNIALDSDSPANCTACDGSAAITIVGGTMPYSYNWSNGNSTEDPTDLCSGLNTITVTDANGCTAILDVNIGSISTLAATAIVDNDVTCFSVCDGQATVTASAGTPPYTYVWSDSQTTPTATNLCAGGYSVTITDVANCVVVETITITEPTELLANAVEDNPVSCAGGTDGQATVTATDGTPAYTYNWDNGESTATATMLTGGSHNVTVTDANGCTVIANVNITEPAALTASATGEALLCNGDTDGDITLTVNGGTMPYTYQWTNGAGTDQNPTGLGANTYTVTITDANSCTITASADITEPAALTATAVQDSSVSCPGETDGQATVTQGGGTTPYTYEWDNSETTATATMLGAGAHDVTITDANNCVITASVTIDDAPPLNIALDSDSPANCTACDGSAAITIVGGTMPYTYNWSNGNSTEDPTDLCSGLNTITVTDANGCTAILDVNIGSISTLAATAIVDNDVTCFSVCDGQATVTASAGTAPYTYVWSDSQTTPTATNLCAGGYSVTITDVANCVVVETITITEPTELLANAVEDSPVTCALGTDGQATVTATDGTPAYTYNWDNGESTATAIMLTGGSHNVTVTDANGCTVIANVNITEPAALTASATGEALLCNGDTDGDITLTVNGGTTPYTFQWDNGAGTDQNPTGLGANTYTVTVTDANSCTITASADITEPTALTATAVQDSSVSCPGETDGQATVTLGGGTTPYTYQWDNSETTATATMLGAGAHDVTITDANNCVITASVTIDDAPPLNIALDSDSPANCTACDGSAAITIVGGTMPYTYNWSNGNSTEDPTDLCSGLNTITVTDANGCTAILDVNIGSISTLAATAIVDNDVTCFSVCDGQATVTASAGTAPYTYVWSDSQTTPTATNLCAGGYSVTITDIANCVVVETITITEPTELLASAVEDNPVSCAGGTDGQATVTATDGTPAYTYNWDNGESTATAIMLTDGSHNVTVTDANGCTVIANVNITEPAALTASATGEALLCNGDIDGDITLTVNGGTTPYTFQWDNGAGTDQNPTGLGANTYTVTITDANSCTITASADITEPAALTATAVQDSSVSCPGETDGQATVTLGGGTTPYTYEWDNSETTATATMLGAGTHDVTITDANNCVITASVTIDDAAPLGLVLDSDTPANCTSCDGTAGITVNGGTMPYTYTWSNGNSTEDPADLCSGINAVTVTDANGCSTTLDVNIGTISTLTATTVVDNQISCFSDCDGQATVTASSGAMPYTYQWSDSQTTATATNLCAGTYSVTVTDANNCVVVESTIITEPTELTATANVDASGSCAGGNNGGATVTALGGTPGYTYNWDNGEMTASATSLSGGAHDVTVTDANNCIVIASVTIAEPDPLVASATGEDLLCNGDTGTLTSTVTGGTTPYTYQWDNGAGTDPSPTGIGAGTYIITVTDANNCAITASADITEPTALTASAVEDAPVSCTGQSDGQATATAGGGTPPYIYLWDNNETTATATMLSAGVHDITITDANSCIIITNVSITDPDPITVTLDNNTPANCTTCNGGAGISVTGGTPPYAYDWSGGATIEDPIDLCSGTNTVTVTDANGCTATLDVSIGNISTLIASAVVDSDVSCFGVCDGQATAAGTSGNPPYSFVWSNGQGTDVAVNLCAGAYTVTVTDVDNCIDIATITIAEPTAVDATAVEDMPVSCPGGNDGQASVTATGGIAPYTYEWDANTGAQMTPVATMLSGGTYVVTITDANNCTFATSVLVNEPIDPVVIIIDNTTPSNCTSCDGTASISISGGTAPYSVEWSNSDTTEDPTGLCAGINTVTVTDANGCQAIEPVNISNTSSLAATTTLINNVTCANACDGSASVTPTGGNPPYAFLWDNNQTTDIATGLCVGTHFVTVTDQDGCLSATSVDITEPTAIVASAVGEALACNGDMDGNITLTVNGGTPPYAYQWDNGAGTVQNPSGLGAGTYTVTITDANSCIINASADITQSTLLTTSAVGQDVNCNGGADGNITLTVNGGTLPYTFVWDNGAGTGQNPSGLSAGTYNVVITDANGCTANASATLSEPTILTASAQGEALDCNGDTDGNITLTVNGGTLPYTFVWDNGAGTGQNPSGLSADTYSVVITDNNGCQVTAQASITEPTLLTASATGEALACNGDTDGNISLTVNGGTAPYTYQWTNGAGTVQNPTGLGVGTYSVVVTDNNGCTANATATVTEPTVLTATTTGQDVSCFGLSDGQATVTANGGTAPYSYQWDNGEVSNPAVFLNAGQHEVTITDANGCQVENTVNIGTPAALIPTGLSSTPVTCFGGNDGTATIAASGGTPPYTYAWNTTPAQTGTTATNLPAGVVQVIITDANGCSLPPINITVTQPDTPVSAITSNTEPTCNGGDDGTVSVEAAGGIPSYTYEWSTGDIGQTVFDVSAGTYTVTITDSNGCTAVESTTLGEPAPVVSSLLTTGVTCFGDENGSILVETTIGGTAPYVYSLDGENYQASDFFGGLAGGNYTVYTQDDNGCGGSVSTIVDEPFELIVDLGVDIIMELGDSVQLFAQTNTLDSVSYSWTPTTGLSCTDCPDPWVTGLETTSYQVQISNANGCTATDNITITVDKNRNIYIPNVFSPTNDGTNDVFMIYGGQGVVQVDVFRVYDRWGELLWEAKDFPTDDPTYGWNGIFRGQTMNPAVFVYYAEVTFIDGVTLQYKGDVTLVR